MNKKIIKTVFWDLDGTLIDSEHIHEEAAFTAFKHLSIDSVPCEIPAGIENKAGFELLTGIKVDNEKNYAVFKKWDDLVVEIAISNISSNQAIKQSISLFNHFNSLGMTQFIVSNSYYNLIDHSLKQIGIRELVKNIFSRDTVEFGKPHPQLYLNAIASQNNPVENCMSFEDSGTGIKAAHAAGIDVVGIGEKSIMHKPKIALNTTEDNWLDILNQHYYFR